MKNKNYLNKELFSRRVFFRNDDLRNEFFAKLKTRFGNWTKLRNKFNIYKSRLERFRNSAISIPYGTFIDLISYFSEEDKNYFLNKVILKDKHWGRRKGGISTYKHHKYIFEKGRKIGAEKTSNSSKYSFKLDIPLTTRLCELIGAFIGDGFANKYGGSYMIQYTGHSKLDKEYIVKTNSNPIITEKDNTIRLTIYSKEFYTLLTKRFKFVPGKKAYTVTMPQEIINSKGPKLINHCIRGIFDTDGCIFTDKRKAYKSPYMRIALNMKSKNLMSQLHSLLLNQGINSTITENLDRIQINGFENCKKFIEKIGFSNKRHLDKIKF